MKEKWIIFLFSLFTPETNRESQVRIVIFVFDSVCMKQLHELEGDDNLAVHKDWTPWTSMYIRYGSFISYPYTYLSSFLSSAHFFTEHFIIISFKAYPKCVSCTFS